MDWVNNSTAFWLTACFFHLPEPDYMQIWFAQSLRSDVLPNVPGC